MIRIKFLRMNLVRNIIRLFLLLIIEQPLYVSALATSLDMLVKLTQKKGSKLGYSFVELPDLKQVHASAIPLIPLSFLMMLL
jgi:hypothetical protein